MSRRRQKYRPNANPTGVNSAGVPVDEFGVEYTELPERIKKALEEILKRKGRFKESVKGQNVDSGSR